MMDNLKEFWYLFTSGVALIYWLVRLEAKVVNVAKESASKDEDLKEATNALEARLAAQRREDLALRRADTERLYSTMQTIQADIKTLLMEIGK